jgi:hypothetical protein
MKDFFKYGEKVDGYDVRVINEREARAAAGILFTIGLLSLMNAVMLEHGVVTRYFIAFFTLDFLIRVINPSYSPSMLLGRIFVQNQIPEYVGAAQKRFAWGIGLLLALPMFYMLVIHWQPNPIKVLICLICLLLLITESAFSVCLGCKIYSWIMPKPPTHCPGGACEIKQKDKIQTFNTAQKIIVTLTFVTAISAFYAYLYKVDNKTNIGKFISMKTMSAEKKKALQEKRFQQMAQEFDNDDDF